MDAGMLLARHVIRLNALCLGEKVHRPVTYWDWRGRNGACWGYSEGRDGDVKKEDCVSEGESYLYQEIILKVKTMK